MADTFDISLLRNVQPTDRKMSVSKEFVGPKKREEQKHKNPTGNESDRKKPAKPADDDEHGLIDITI